MLSEYITSLANVSFCIVVYMYAGFSIREKIRCGLRFFGVFLCGFAVLRFSDPLTPPSVKIPTGLQKTVHAVTGVRYLLTCSEDSLFCVTQHLPPLMNTTQPSPQLYGCGLGHYMKSYIN